MFRFGTFLKDVKSISRYVLIATLLFVGGGVLGWISTGTLQQIMLQQISGISEISNELQQSDNVQWSFFTFIFLNNAIKSVLVIFAGALGGIIPIVFLVINGGVLGFLLHAAWQQGISYYDVVVKGLLPHGIIEIPAIIIACAFGLKLGVMIYKALGEIGMEARSKKVKLGSFMRQTGTASLWIVILLFIAAIIESTLTYVLVQ
ncbi:stage II sporulation protein M [Neobacillus mesonae]|nr:stage II sporulation protein M [Neobacillus mesonae]